MRVAIPQESGAEATGPTVAPSRWGWFALSFVAFWLLGVGMLWWTVVPYAMFFSIPRERRVFPKTAIVLLALGGWLALVMVVLLAVGQVQADRVPGAAFAVICWFGAAFVYAAIASASDDQRRRFTGGLITIGSLQGLVATVAIVLNPSPLSSVRFPAASVLGNTGVGAWATADLAYRDFFGESIVRSEGMMAAASWSSGFACSILLILVLGRRWLRGTGMSRSVWIVAILANVAMLYFSFSRVSAALLIGALAVYALFWACSRLRSGLLLAWCVVTLGIFAFLNFYPWQSTLLEQNQLRPGSSVARFSSYDEGIAAATDGGFLQFLGGHGVKPFIEELGRGAGSESTYVSILVRGGIIGIVLLFTFFVSLTVRAARDRDWAAFAVVVVVGVHAVVADLDVGTLTIVLAMLPISKQAHRRENHGDELASRREYPRMIF